MEEVEAEKLYAFCQSFFGTHLRQCQFSSFSAKNASVSAYLLESSLARFKKCRLLFYNYCVFARVEIENGNILLFLSSLFVSSSMKESP